LKFCHKTLTISITFIFCALNSLLKFNTFIFFVLSCPWYSYSSLSLLQASLAISRFKILIKIYSCRVAFIMARALPYFATSSLWFLVWANVGLFWRGRGLLPVSTKSHNLWLSNKSSFLQPKNHSFLLKTHEVEVKNHY